jgi:hypothetical protein
MRNRNILTVLLVLPLFGYTECGNQAHVEGPCTIVATVRDMTGLEDCHHLLELSTGEKLQPVAGIPSNWRWKDNEKVRVSFEVMEGYVSSCMAGVMVKINCIESFQ